MANGFGLPLIDFSGPLNRIAEGFSRGYDQAQAPEILEAMLRARGAPGGLSTLANAGQPAPGGNVLSALGMPQTAQTPSFMGGDRAMTLPTGSNKENETKFVGALKDGGLTNPFGLAAAAAYAQHESRYSPQNITGSWSDPSESGQAGTSGGILSWRGDRLANMRASTRGEQDPVTAQAKFFLTEDPDTTLALQNARSPEEANDILAKAWKFAGYNRPSGGEYAARLGTTRSYLNRLAGLDSGPSSAPQRVSPQPVRFADDEAGVQRLEQSMGMVPQQAADLPARGAVPAQFQIPPGPQSTLGATAVPPPGLSGAGDGRSGRPFPPSSDNNARNFPPAAPVGLPGNGTVQAGLDPALLARALNNQVTAPLAQAALAAQFKSGDDFTVQAVGDSLYRVNKRTGAVELVPGVTKPQTTTVGQGQTLVDQLTGRPIFASPAAPANVAAGGRLVDPTTGREVYAAPDKPVSVAPGGRLVDPRTGGEVYAAPEKSATPGFVQMNGRLLITDPDTGTARDVTPKDLPQGYRPATAEERKAFNVQDATPLFIGPDGKPQSLGGQNISINAGEKAGEAAIGQDYGKRFVEMQRAGGGAASQLSTIATMERAMNAPGFYSGTGGPARLAFNKALASLGVKDPKLVAPAEMFDALSNKVILDGLGGSLGAGISNGDRDFIQRTAPDLAKTPEGNRQLLAYARALAERQQQVAKFAREYYAKNGRKLDPGFDEALAQWAEANPITPGGRRSGQGAPQSASPQQAPQAGPQQAPAAPAVSDLEAEARRRGLLR